MFPVTRALSSILILTLVWLSGCNGSAGNSAKWNLLEADNFFIEPVDGSPGENQFVRVKNVGFSAGSSYTGLGYRLTYRPKAGATPQETRTVGAIRKADRTIDAQVPADLRGNWSVELEYYFQWNDSLATATPERPAEVQVARLRQGRVSFSRTECGPRATSPAGAEVIDLGIRPIDQPADFEIAPFLDGGVTPFTYRLSPNSVSLPPGLGIIDGRVVGTPTVSGTFNFELDITDSCAEGGRVSRLKFRIRIEAQDECDDPPTISAPSTLTGTAGAPFEATGTLTGTGTITVALTLPGGAPAPAWLQVVLTDTRAWRLFGTPPAAQDLTVTLRATDNCDPPQSSTRDISLSISACEGAPPALQNFTLPIAAINQPWEATLGVTGGTGAITLEPVGAPLWISINGTTVSGIPPDAGYFPMSFRARDACGRVSATVAGSLRVIDTSPGVWNAYIPFPDISGSDYAVIAYQNRPVVLIDGSSNVPGEGGQPLVEVYFGLNEDPQANEDWQKLRLETLNPPSTSVTPALTIHDGRLAAVYRANDTGTPYLRLRQATKLNPVAEGDWLATSVPLAAPESEMLMEHSRLSLASVGGRLVTAARNQVYISNSGTPVDPPASNWTKHGVTGESGSILFRYKNPQLAVGDERLWMLVTASQTPMEHLLFRASKVLPSTDADWSQQTFDAGVGSQTFADFRPSFLVRSNGRPALSYYTRVAGSTARTRQQRLLLATTAEPTSPSDWDELLLDPIGGGSSSLVQVNGTLMLAYGFRYSDYLAQNPEQEPRFWRIATSRTTPGIHPNQLSDWWPVQTLFENDEEDPTATQMRLRGRLLLYSVASRVGMIGSSENSGGAVIPASANPPS